MTATEEKPKFNFSSTIPNSWSRSGIYRKNERGQVQPLDTQTEYSELGSYLKMESSR